MTELLMRAKTAALVALAEHGKTTDLQEALVHGSGSIAPGALEKMVHAAVKETLDNASGIAFDFGEDYPSAAVMIGNAIKGLAHA